MACLGDEDKDSRCVSMTLLLTLPVESRVSPLIPKATLTSSSTGQEEIIEDDQIHGSSVKEEEEEEENLVFESFDFEDYAWRVYHERLHLRDPLDRYRI